MLRDGCGWCGGREHAGTAKESRANKYAVHRGYSRFKTVSFGLVPLPCHVEYEPMRLNIIAPLLHSLQHCLTMEPPRAFESPALTVLHIP